MLAAHGPPRFHPGHGDPAKALYDVRYEGYYLTNGDGGSTSSSSSSSSSSMMNMMNAEKHPLSVGRGLRPTELKLPSELGDRKVKPLELSVQAVVL